MTRIISGSNDVPYKERHWKGGEFFAFANMDPKKEGFADNAYRFYVDVPEVGAPDGTVITCVTPEPASTKGPRGYASIRHGNVSNGPPPTEVKPRKVVDLKRLEDDFSLDYRAMGQGDANILFDSFLLRDPKDHASKALELGVMPRPAADAVAFAKTGKDLGVFTDRFGVAWRMPSFPSGYVMPIPVAGPILTGAIDRLEMLRWLLSKGVGSPDLWYTGTGLGLEPIAGTTQLLIRRWSPIVS